MHDLLEYLINEMNPERNITAYTIRHDGVKGTWFLKNVDIPVDDDEPTIVSWTKNLNDSLMFGSKDMIEDFALAHMVPRPCSIVKIKATKL